MPLITTSRVTSTISGDAIVIMRQHACHGKNKTIRSSPQIDHCKKKVDDRSIMLGGGQHATTLDNYKIPLSISNALPCMPLRPHTDDEW